MVYRRIALSSIVGKIWNKLGKQILLCSYSSLLLFYLVVLQFNCCFYFILFYFCYTFVRAVVIACDCLGYWLQLTLGPHIKYRLRSVGPQFGDNILQLKICYS